MTTVFVDDGAFFGFVGMLYIYYYSGSGWKQKCPLLPLLCSKHSHKAEHPLEYSGGDGIFHWHDAYPFNLEAGNSDLEMITRCVNTAGATDT